MGPKRRRGATCRVCPMKRRPDSLDWIDFVPAAVAALDEDGTIVGINHGWRELETSNGAGVAEHGLGENYLKVCEASGDPKTAAILREVIVGKRAKHTLEYTCHSGLARHWYRMEAVFHPPCGALLFHWHINPPKDPSALEQAKHAASPCHEVIFLVEDNYQLRILAARTLRQLGYTVVTASNGTEALELAKAELTRTDLLLSDIILGDALGTDLAREFQRQHPRLKLLFVSGYAPQTVSADLTQLPHHFLEKPFTPSDLAAAVRRCLDEASPTEPA